MINDIFDKINLHNSRLKLAYKEIVDFEVLDVEIFDDFEKLKTIDTFIYRFIKLQDLVGNKLFKLFLDEIGEYQDNMSLLDVLDKLERFKIISDSKKWMYYRKLRNQLTHEYPNNEDDIIDGIKLSLIAYKEIVDIVGNIKDYLNQRK